jgi:FdhD protein
MADLTTESIEIQRFPDRVAVADEVAVEEPLQIVVDDADLAVVMRTPGRDRDLVAGFLLTEGVIEDGSDLRALGPCTDPNRDHAHNTYLVRLASGCARPDALARAQRHFITSASCGVCGKRTIESVLQFAPPHPAPMDLPAHLLASVGEAAQARQEAFKRTGGLHAAMLLGPGPDHPVRDIAEDVGRHNAVDKVLGQMLLKDTLPLDRHVLWLSGRASMEMIQKALVARVGAIICVGAPTSLAVSLAQASQLTLVGFARGPERFNVYHGAVIDEPQRA